MNESKLKVLQTIAVAMLFADVLYIPLIYLLQEVVKWQQPLTLDTGSVERYSFYVAAFLVLSVVALRRFIFSPANLHRKSDDEAFNRWYTMDIIVMSVASSIGVVGLLSYFLGATYFRALMVIIIGLLVHFTLFPFRFRYQLRFDQLKAMRKEAGTSSEGPES